MSVEAPSAPQDREAYITELIVAKHAAQRRISELEDTVATLRQQLEQKHACDNESISEMHGEAAARRPTSAPAQEAVLKRGSLDQIHRWNKELVRTVEKLQRAMIHLETDSKGQLVLLTDELAKIVDENAQLRHENDSLKERVADDVLRQRQANRIEMASEKARIASQVRQAGKQRLESMEAVLMEAHDDLYHVQRWDAGVAPQRDVNFVFHYVSNISFPSLNAVEDFVMNVYKEILLNTCRKLEGYRVFSYRGMEVFAFQRATVALEFAKACHEQIATLSWPERSKTLPYFATIAQYGEVLFQGPRMHTCIYACTPQCTIDPASGRALYFGNETRAAVEAALKLSAVGEIVANDVWARLVCMELRVSANSSSPVVGNVMDVRTSLGKGWDVIGMPGSLSIICSILPDSLKARRGVEFHLLSPTPKYPSMLVQVDEVLEAIVGGMRSIAAEPSGKKMLALMSSSGSDAALSEGADDVDHAGLLLKFYSMKQDRDKLITMYQNTEKLCAALEKKNMEGEDRFQKSKQKPLDTAETAYVCTVDTGDDSVWKKILISSISAEEYEEIRNTIRAHINSAAKHYYGFLMNGNNYDIFTYVFREVEQAIAFVSEVYIKVNRTGTKCSYVTQGSSEEVFLMRAGISGGSMSTIYRTRENDTVKCTGPIIRLSGTLCDLSQDGEILAMDDVVRAFHRKNENLLDTQYNIVKQPGKFVGGFDTSAVVHSILPKPFAYRRQKLMNTTGTTTNRSASAALMVIKTHFPRQDVAEALTQVLERLERTETARMESEDLYAHSQPLKQLANTWMFVKQRTTATPSATGTPASSRRNSTASLSAGSAVGTPTDADATELHSLAFLMCDVVGIAALGRELGEVILTRVLRHYNFIVQEIFGQCRGCIIKTNSRAAYIVAFEDGCLALEAATLIQQRLLRSDWPEELHTLEPSLRVRDSKSGIFLFHGVRAQVAVHYSNKFGWKKISTEDGPTRVDVFGLAMEELLTIARFTHGGEIRLSRPLLKNVAGTTTGKLLTDQLEMEIVSIPQTLDELPRAMPKKGRRSSAGGHGPRSISRSSRSFSIGEDDCITAVPKLLHGRFSIIPNHRRRSMRGSIGGGGAAIIASPPSSPPKPISAKEVERVSPAASLTKSQGMWCSQAQGENPLPTAEFVDWQRTDISVSMHPEVEEIQRAATELLALFPMELTECAAQVFANLSTTELSYTLFLRYSRDLIHFVKTAAQVGSGILKAPSLAKDGAPSDVVFPVSSVVRTLPPMMKGSVNVPHPPANSRASRGANSGGGSYASGGGGSSTASSKSSYDPYRAALNFMDDACRYLSTQSGTALGKLTTIPSAPPSKFSRSNGRRAL